MQVFSKFGNAKKANTNNGPILRISNGSQHLYIVGVEAMDEIALLHSAGLYAGTVILKHLDRLGNANWAEPHPQHANQKRIWPSLEANPDGF